MADEATSDSTVHLEAEECWELLRSVDVGRLAVATGDDVEIFPVNFIVEERRLLFRTSPGTKLVELARNRRVAFETDGWTDASAWSVVVKGEASELDYPSELRHAQRTGLETWAPDEKDRYVEITPSRITGRRFTKRSPEPRSQLWYF
jgi:nitroimidazol reductase NimA-like FMN-containing flavoprotein (pyridoxamine 5'-phosphate oxidase superfamily)